MSKKFGIALLLYALPLSFITAYDWFKNSRHLLMTTNQLRSSIVFGLVHSVIGLFRNSRHLMLSTNQIQNRNPIQLGESRFPLGVDVFASSIVIT